MDLHRGDLPIDIHHVRVKVAAPRGSSRSTRCQREAFEMPLAVTPVEAKLRDDRIEFGCPRSTCDHGGAAPLDAFSSLLPPYESSVEQAHHGQCRNELFVVHDRLPLASSVVLPLSSPQVDEQRGSGLDCPMAVQPVDHLERHAFDPDTWLSKVDTATARLVAPGVGGQQAYRCPA